MAEDGKWVYPETKRGEQKDDYHGVMVADPYRWLEDDNAEETKAWVETQNRLTFAYLQGIPQRAAIRQRLEKLWDYEKYGLPYREGSRYFISKNDGLQNQSVLYTMDAIGQPLRELLDPNRLSADGTVAVSTYAVSRDARWLAYGLSSAGSDWTEFKVRDIATGEDRTDHLRWVKFSGASWAADHSGFYYSRYAAPAAGEEFQQANYFQKLYFHRLGDAQDQDQLIYERPDQKEWGFGGQVTEDGRYLIIQVWRGTDPKNALFYKDLQQDGPVVELLKDFDAEYDFIDNDGPVFWIRTDLSAPRGRLLSIDTRQPARDQWQELIPQTEDTLAGVSVVGDRFFANYMRHAHSVVKRHRLDGTLESEVKLPGLGSVGGFGGKRKDGETYYAYSSFTFPTTIYRYDIEKDQSSVLYSPQVDFKPDDFETTQVFYTSRDGTRVPMFLTYKKGLQLNGQNPTYLYGYGGFNISLRPAFSVSNLVWMELGGVFAQPNLRGGGEYGEDWHKAGNLANKQNVFDDFLAAAQWLIDQKYTSTPKLAIGGGSNGGLLVGACMTQRPDLFAAALPAVGVMDMLRFHKFTIGWAWVPEYGSADDATQFPILHRYSPLHNLKPGTSYPATLVTTGDHDDRVVPAHSFKFAAALQSSHSGPSPVLIRIETRAGHGAGKPTSKVLDELADKWSFLVKNLHMSPP